MASRRRRRAPPVLHVRHRPRLRPRLRGDAARRHRGLRDVGRARRRRVERRAAVPRLDRRQPCRRAGRPGSSDAGMVGRLRRSGQGRSTPTAGSSCAPTCSAAARARPDRRRRRRSTASRTVRASRSITIRDMVRAQARLADHLGIGAWHTVIGGSMGGMQVLEWGVMYPDRVRGLVPIATCMQATAQQIAWGSIGRRVIALDPRWRGGDYYDAAPGDGPGGGPGDRPHGRPGDVPQRQRVHRAVRPGDRPPRRPRRPPRAVAAVRGRALPRPPRRQARAPLRRQQLPRHRQGDGPPRPRPRPRQPRGGDVADQRTGAVRSGSRPTCSTRPTSSASSSSCWRRSAVAAGYAEIDSPHGHDAFLINLDRLADPVADFLDCRKLP